MNQIQVQVGKVALLVAILTQVSSCKGIHPHSQEAKNRSQPRITPKLEVEWTTDDRVAIRVGILNEHPFSVCLPTFAKSEAGSIVEVTTADGTALRPKLTEDIIPRAHVGVNNIASNTQLEFVVPLSLDFTEVASSNFRIRFQALAARCEEGVEMVSFPINGDTMVLIDSGFHQFSRPETGN